MGWRKNRATIAIARGSQPGWGAGGLLNHRLPIFTFAIYSLDGWSDPCYNQALAGKKEGEAPNFAHAERQCCTPPMLLHPSRLYSQVVELSSENQAKVKNEKWRKRSPPAPHPGWVPPAD